MGVWVGVCRCGCGMWRVGMAWGVRGGGGGGGVIVGVV